MAECDGCPVGCPQDLSLAVEPFHLSAWGSVCGCCWHTACSQEDEPFPAAGQVLGRVQSPSGPAAIGPGGQALPRNIGKS